MRYRKIESKIWNDEKFIQLTPMQQRLFFYILTSPFANLTGIYVLKEGYVCDDLKCLPKDFRKDLAKIIELGLVEYDQKLCVLYVKNFLKHNPITNPNQVKAAIKSLYELPKSPIVSRFLSAYRSDLERVGKGLVEGLIEVLSKPGTGAGAGTGTESGTETEENTLSGKPDSVEVKQIPYESILENMNEVLNMNYRNTSEFKKLVKARWNDGFRLPDFIKVCTVMKMKWGSDPKMQQYLRPITLFSTKMDGYLNQTVSLADRGASRNSASVLGMIDRLRKGDDNVSP